LVQRDLVAKREDKKKTFSSLTEKVGHVGMGGSEKKDRILRKVGEQTSRALFRDSEKEGSGNFYLQRPTNDRKGRAGGGKGAA